MPSKAWAKGSTPAWRRLRLEILNRDNYTCQIKGPNCTSRATTVDHVMGKGISESPEHLRAACKPCNAAHNPRRTDPPPRTSTDWTSQDE